MNYDLLDIKSFGFDGDDLKLLVSVINRSLVFEASKSESVGKRKTISNLFSSDDEVMRTIDNYRNLKKLWVTKWTAKTKTSLNIPELYTSDEIKNKFNGMISQRQAAFIAEISSFQPYYDLTGERKMSDGLKFTNNDKDLFYMGCSLETGISQSRFQFAARMFHNCSEGMSRIMAGKSNSWNFVGVGILVAALLVDPIAGAIGAAMELSGAAAFMAGLAFLGGGAIASGGFGVTGGILVIMSGGAIIAYGVGEKEYDIRLKQCSKEQMFIHCAKLYTFTRVFVGADSVKKQVCSQALLLQREFEQMADDLAIDRDDVKSKDSAAKAKVLSAFRKYFRENVFSD